MNSGASGKEPAAGRRPAERYLSIVRLVDIDIVDGGSCNRLSYVSIVYSGARPARNRPGGGRPVER